MTTADDLRRLQLLTTAEVATIARLRPATVLRAVAEGRLRALRPSLRDVRYRPADVADWLGLEGRDDDRDAVLAWLAEAEGARPGQLCPRCARNPQGPSGLCPGCDADKQREATERDDRARARRLRYWHSDKGRAAAARRQQVRANRTTEGTPDAQ